MPNPYVAAAGLVLDLGSKLVQGRTEEAFDGLNPFASAGEPLTVEFTAAGQQKVAHKLDRVPVGWNPVCRLGSGQVWDYQEPDSQFFYLESDSALTIKILVS